MIKVIELIDALFDGGAENIGREYAEILDKKEFDTVVVTILDTRVTANYKRAKEAALKVRSVYGGCGVVSKGLRRIFGKSTIPAKLKKIIREEKPDVIHLHSPLLKYLVPIADELKGINLLYTCHSNPSGFFCGVHAQEKTAAEALIKSNGLRLVALHEKMRVELNEMFGVTNTVAVKNGVNFEKFQKSEESRATLRKELGISADAFVLGHIGRLAKVKNHSFLLDVFSEVCKKNEKAQLLLVGNGALEGQIKEKIAALGLSDKVTMLSHREDIPQLLNAMDVFVFPSFYEGLPVTLVEAQAAGLKCVVSDRINAESFLTNKTIPLDIERPAAEWAEAVLNDDIKNDTYGDLSAFDINKEIKRLELIYKKEL